MEKDIVGFDSIYTITEDGDVFSYKHNNKRKLKPQKASQSKKGYFQVRLFEPKGSGDVFGKLHYVHRLVWETYKGDIPEGKQIDHIDSNTSNNNVDNLQLLTPRQNMNKYNKKRWGDSTRKRRDEFIKLYEELGTYKKVAEVTGVPYQRIYRTIKDVVHKFDRKTGKHTTVRYNPNLDDAYTRGDRRKKIYRKRGNNGRFM